MTTKNRDSNLDEQKDDYLFDDACKKYDGTTVTIIWGLQEGMEEEGIKIMLR